MIQTSDRFGGTGYNNSSFCIGFSDGTNEVCVHAQHDSEVTPGQKCFRTMWNGQCSVRVQSTTNDGVINAVSVSSFNTDQVVLSIDDGRLNGEEFECFLIAIGGDDVDSVIAGHHDDLGTTAIGNPVPIGHAPDMIFTLTDHDSAFDFKGKNNRQADNGASISYGVAINVGNQTQMCAAWSPALNPAEYVAIRISRCFRFIGAQIIFQISPFVRTVGSLRGFLVSLKPTDICLSRIPYRESVMTLF